MSNLLIHAFQTHPMFNGISLTSCQTLMNCLGCIEKSYKKDQIIPVSENSARQIGIVISAAFTFFHALPKSYSGLAWAGRMDMTASAASAGAMEKRRSWFFMALIIH